MPQPTKAQDIEEYFAKLPQHTKEILQKIRELVKQLLPQASESISYDIPAYKLANTQFFYFGAWKSHIGFYNMKPKDLVLRKEIEPYITSKGTIQFPLDKEISYDLISRLIEDKLKTDEVK